MDMMIPEETKPVLGGESATRTLTFRADDHLESV
jgi:hypothetical protein